jgi:hypothetical protein
MSQVRALPGAPLIEKVGSTFKVQRARTRAILLLHQRKKISIIRSLSQGIPFFNGPLAQLVEQLTLNQRVEGSTPSRLTIPTPRAVSSKRWLGGTLLSLLLPYVGAQVVRSADHDTMHS